MSEASLVRAWTLVSYVITDEQGEVVNAPFGQDPSDLLIYTESGYMSAHLASATARISARNIFLRQATEKRLRLRIPTLAIA